jgi:D-fructose 1,6-bisphosphatase (EC 3.1.3.11)
MHTGTTLTQFIIEEQRRTAGATGDFTSLLNDVVIACKAISNVVNKGALLGVMGSLDSENVQGETQKKLDVITNDIMIGANEWGGHLAGMASEEMDELYPIPSQYPLGKYLLVFDPARRLEQRRREHLGRHHLLDPQGAGRRPRRQDRGLPAARRPAGVRRLRDLRLVDHAGADLRPRHQRLHARPRRRRIRADPPQHEIPTETKEFAINASNMRFWEKPVQRYVDECLAGKTGPRGKDFNMRWVASMVAEVHRILTRGGVFMYPKDTKDPSKAGKLRLLYEANPMAFIVEQAGGAATTGYARILDLAPEGLHQRVPVILGSKTEVDTVTGYHHEKAA